jgi:hypothetical protein
MASTRDSIRGIAAAPSSGELRARTPLDSVVDRAAAESGAKIPLYNPIDEQRAANLSALPYFDSFASHRERLTALIDRHAPAAPSRLCILGAGNAYDLDLARLATTWREIHLVDIDDAALGRAYARQSPATRARLFLHAPIDLSGLFERIDSWRQMMVTPSEMAAYADDASDRIAAILPARFDLVVSACVLTQMQLAMLTVLSSSHRLFEATRQLLNVMHLRTLSKLLSTGGRALLVNDITSSALCPRVSLATGDLNAVMAEALRSGRCFYAAHPELLQWAGKVDPVLRRTAQLSSPIDVWRWQNGAEKSFLVYAMELRRIAA